MTDQRKKEKKTTTISRCQKGQDLNLTDTSKSGQIDFSMGNTLFRLSSSKCLRITTFISNSFGQVFSYFLLPCKFSVCSYHFLSLRSLGQNIWITQLIWGMCCYADAFQIGLVTKSQIRFPFVFLNVQSHPSIYQTVSTTR